MYLVSKEPNKKRYSGKSDERLFKTRKAAQERVKKVKKVSGKKYYISKID